MNHLHAWQKKAVLPINFELFGDNVMLHVTEHNRMFQEMRSSLPHGDGQTKDIIGGLKFLMYQRHEKPYGGQKHKYLYNVFRLFASYMTLANNYQE